MEEAITCGSYRLEVLQLFMRRLQAIVRPNSRLKIWVNLDELGYVPLSKADSELLFQVISQRQERLPIIIAN